MFTDGSTAARNSTAATHAAKNCRCSLVMARLGRWLLSGPDLGASMVNGALKNATLAGTSREREVSEHCSWPENYGCWNDSPAIFMVTARVATEPPSGRPVWRSRAR